MQGKASSRVIWILGCLVGGFALSVFSGYSCEHRPWWTTFTFTPLGLLLRPDPKILSYGSACSFNGIFSFSLDYFKVFLLTCLLESPFYFIALRPAPWLSQLSILVFANFCTHPFVFFLFPCLISKYLTSLLASEVFAALVETAIVFRSVRGNPDGGWSAVIFTAALIVLANLFSWQTGI